MENSTNSNPPEATGVPSSSDWFSSFLKEGYVTAEGIEKTKRIFECGQASHEVIVIATALRSLAEACDDAAQFCRDDERDLTAEAWDQRAGNYRNCYHKLVEEFDGNLDDENTQMRNASQ